MKKEERKSYAEFEERLFSKYGAKRILAEEAAEYIPLTYGGIEEAEDKLFFATDEVFCLKDKTFLLPSNGEKVHKGVCKKVGCVLVVETEDGFVKWWKTYGTDGDYGSASEFYKELKTFLPNYKK